MRHSVFHKESHLTLQCFTLTREVLQAPVSCASRLPCALTAAYEWQLICSHRHLLENHFSVFPDRIRICLLSSKHVLQESGGEVMGNSVTFLLPPFGILYEKSDFKNFLGNPFKPINESFTIFLPLHVSWQPSSQHLPKQNFQDQKCKMPQNGWQGEAHSNFLDR